MKSLKKQWRDLCNEYVRLFIEKHDLESGGYENFWVSNDPGTIICLCDMFINMDDIRYDIDNNIPKEKFERWYWESLKRNEYHIQYMNYPSFCQGAPDPIPSEKLEKILSLRERLEEVKQEFDESVRDYLANTKYF